MRQGGRTFGERMAAWARALGVVLALTLALVGCSGGAQSREAGSAVGSAEATAGLARLAAKRAATATVPRYQQLDARAFLDSCDRLEELAQQDDADAVLALYDQVYADYARLSDNDTAAYLAYCDDVSDTDLRVRQEQASADLDACEAAVTEAAASLCVGPNAQAFREHVGADAFDAISLGGETDDQLVALSQREQELVNDYHQIINQADEEDLSDRKVNEQVGPIYLELVDVRTKIARLNGYENYATYADETYWRDYGGKEAAAFCDAVKEIAPRYFELYYSGDVGNYEGRDFTAEQMIGLMARHADEIDPVVGEALAYLQRNHLYDIARGHDRMEGAFTTVFVANQVPFIYIDEDGSTDFQTLTHEFGHFVDFYHTASPNLLAYGSDGNMDLSEVQSNGLQALYMRFYDDVFGADADAARRANLMDLVANVVDGCIFDEFQREVYAHPEMTLDELNACYRRICQEYGDLGSGPDDYWWQYVDHNFDSPMYYISYAASGIVALEIWDQSQTDYAGACKTWRAFIDAGCFDYGYLELMDKLGLHDLTDKKGVVAVCNDALDYAEG